MGGGGQSMRLVPEEMRAAASDIGRLSDEARQVEEHLRRSWRRLDYGWQSYARENVEGYFEECSHMVQLLSMVLAQMRDALSKTASLISEADQQSVSSFGFLDGHPEASAYSDGAHRRKMLRTWKAMEAETIDEIEMLQRELSGARLLINKAAGVADDYEKLLENARERLNSIQEHIDNLSDSPSAKMEKGYYSIDKSLYEDSDLLVQKGPTCVAYGALNALQLQGYNISTKEANRIIEELDDDGERTIKDTYELDVALELFEEYGYEAKIVRHPPSDGNLATEYLVGQVQSGEPVCIVTGMSYKGATMGHMMNVVGVELGEEGELINVEVSTNWSTKYETIPGDVFLKEWSSREYLTFEIDA